MDKNTLKLEFLKIKAEYDSYPRGNKKINLDFSNQYRNFCKTLDLIKELDLKIVLYGYGSIGKFITEYLGKNIVLIVDKRADVLGENVHFPSSVSEYVYDYVIVSVFGKEDTIVDLLKQCNVQEEKIFKFPLEYKYKNDWTQEKLLQLDDIKLVVNPYDKGGLAYESKSSYEEANNYIYKEIADRFKPENVFDIGANYGYMSLVFAKCFKDSSFTLVEGSGKLISYIRKNLALNDVSNYRLVHAVCGQNDTPSFEFTINPAGSQDNRVTVLDETWEIEKVSAISLNTLFKINPSSFYFIKIDTQGYEEKIIEGGKEYLDQNNNWIMKVEFAPFCLMSQKTNPTEFLKKMITNYSVCEAPSRARYKHDNLEKISGNKLLLSDAEEFIKYIANNNKNGTGWCDLYIFPNGLL